MASWFFRAAPQSRKAAEASLKPSFFLFFFRGRVDLQRMMSVCADAAVVSKGK